MSDGIEREDTAAMSADAEAQKPSTDAGSRRGSLASEELEQRLSERRQKIDSDGDHFVKTPFSRQPSETEQDGDDASSSKAAETSAPSAFKVRKLIADAQSLVEVRENLELLQAGLQDEVRAREDLKEMVLRQSAALHALREACQDECRKLTVRLDAEKKPQDEAAAVENKLSGKMENGVAAPGREAHDAAAEAIRLEALSQQVARLEEQVKHIESSMEESQLGLSTWLAEHKARQVQTPHRQDKSDWPDSAVGGSAASGGKENGPETAGGPVHFLLATPKPMLRPPSSVSEIEEVDWKEELRVLTGRVAALHDTQTSSASKLSEGLQALNGRMTASDNVHSQLKQRLDEGRTALDEAVRILTENYEDSLNRQTDLRALLLEEVDQRGVFFDGMHKGLEDMLAQQLPKQERLMSERDEKLVADMKAEIQARMNELRDDLLKRFNKFTL
mmetsp:Transcript_6330/g.12130  ORF Transcript_6330/g.12130 Transcript_6330/m.12130 type:complete len:448 (+) Transcript_6330:143-1486(+)